LGVKPLWVPLLPFFVSLACSAATIGSTVGWQDSGYFLCAVHETAVLYPTGYVTYLLLCKAWTLLLFFVDFTLAVHLFSAVCVALSSGAIALAARDLIQARGSLFRTGDEDVGDLRDWAAAGVGVLAATGYTFWYTALLAKGYALYYLILSVLVWRLIRAHESGKGRDFTIVAVLIGLAWQGHPSSVNVGPALLAFVLYHARALGWKGLVGRFGVAAACAFGPMLLLPLIASRPSIVAFGDPRSAEDLAEYLFGGRYTGQSGVFGWAESRILSVPRFAWEEFLGVGLLAVFIGLAAILRSNRRFLIGLVLWILPVWIITVLFKLEGQHDCWFLAAWIPLWAIAGLGLVRLGRYAGPRGRPVVAGLCGVGLVWAIAANGPQVTMRGFTLPEVMGRRILDGAEPGSILILRSDDVVGPALYLHVVRGEKPDVAVVRATHLGEGWYTRALQARYPTLVSPDYIGFRRQVPKLDQVSAGTLAFAHANVAAGHPVYFEISPPAEFVRPEYSIVPAGPYFRLLPKGAEEIDRRYWETPFEAEDVVAMGRRERGQKVDSSASGLVVAPEAYERRVLRMLLQARKNLADWLGHSADPDKLRRAVELYESLPRLEPGYERDISLVLPLGIVHLRLKQPGAAEPWLRKAVALDAPAPLRARAMVGLVEVCLASGRGSEATDWKARTLALPDLEEDLRKRLTELR
jgi:hypothetical protein